MHRYHGRRRHGHGRHWHRPYYGGWGGYPYVLPYYGYAFRPFVPYYNPVLW